MNKSLPVVNPVFSFCKRHQLSIHNPRKDIDAEDVSLSTIFKKTYHLYYNNKKRRRLNRFVCTKDIILGGPCRLCAPRPFLLVEFHLGNLKPRSLILNFIYNADGIYNITRIFRATTISIKILLHLCHRYEKSRMSLQIFEFELKFPVEILLAENFDFFVI